MRKATDEARRSPEARVCFRRRLVERSLTLDLVFHAETFAFDDHRLGVMQQPIQDGGGQRVVLVEDLGPLLKGPVRGNNNHIPADLVVDQWAADGESSSHREFLFLHDV
jgi:hypothetical protein